MSLVMSICNTLIRANKKNKWVHPHQSFVSPPELWYPHQSFVNVNKTFRPQTTSLAEALLPPGGWVAQRLALSTAAAQN